MIAWAVSNPVPCIISMINPSIKSLSGCATWQQWVLCGCHPSSCLVSQPLPNPSLLVVCLHHYSSIIISNISFFHLFIYDRSSCLYISSLAFMEACHLHLVLSTCQIALAQVAVNIIFYCWTLIKKVTML